MAGNKVAQPGQLGDHGAVLVFLHRLIKEQDQGGQDDHRADHAQRHALGHYQADVPAQGQPHSAQRQEAGNGGQTGCGNGGHGLADGGDHCLLVGAAQLLFFLVAMQQEDGEVHGHAQLQQRGQRLGNVADLPQKDVGTKVVRNGEQKSDHKQQRRDRAFQREEQDRQAGAHCTQDIQRHLLIDQRLGVLQDHAHAAKEAILAQHLFDLCHGVHGLLAGAGTFKPDQHHGGVILAKQKLLYGGRQHLGGDAGVDHIAEPESLHDARHRLDVLFHGHQLLGGQALHRDHTGGSQMEIIFQRDLAHHGVQLRRKIG